MKAFLLAHIFLAPFIIFTIGASFNYPLASATIGLLVGIVFCAFRYGIQLPSIFMLAQLIGLLIVVLLMLFGYSHKTGNDFFAVVFTFLAGGAFISVLRKKPWTLELSAGGVGDFAKNPAFLKANNLFSLMWAVIYAWFAFASWQQLPELARWIPLGVGGFLSVIGPKILMRIGIKRGVFEDINNTD